jgi:DNA-binding response OmpR family regulator
MKLILCVEDERRVLENNRKALNDSGYEVLTAENLAEAREYLSKRQPDAIVLDIMLPDGLGLELLTELRSGGSKIPVLLLTAWDKPADVARGLRLGANDYLSKPFEYEVLLARTEAMFRNVEQMPERLTYGAFTFDITSGQAFMNGADLLLTQKEFAMLVLFMQNVDRVMKAEYIYEKIWGQKMNEDAGAVKHQVSNLRKKLKGSGYTVSSTRGEGYCFERE